MTKRFCCVALSNPKSPTNVGSVMRAAGCFGTDEVWYSGRRFEHARQFHTDTHTASDRVALKRMDDPVTSKAESVQLIAVDLVEGATPLAEFEHPTEAVYWFGPEDGSLTQEQIAQADSVIYIPTFGCLNLAATVNVVLYDRATKLNTIIASNAHIVSNRDRNNTTKVPDDPNQ